MKNKNTQVIQEVQGGRWNGGIVSISGMTVFCNSPRGKQVSTRQCNVHSTPSLALAGKCKQNPPLNSEKTGSRYLRQNCLHSSL